MQETKVQYLGWEDLLEKEMATHSSILTGKILWTKELITVHGFTKSQIQLSTRMCAHVHTHTHTHTHKIWVLKDGVQEIPGENSYFYIHETQIEI